MEYVDRYAAMAIQPEVRACYVTGKDPAAQRMENVLHDCELIDKYYQGTAHRLGGLVPRLCVFPESFIHGFGPGWVRDFKLSMEQLAITIPGPEIDALAKKAVEYNMFIAGAAFEILPEYPTRFFNTGFIIDPKGEVILKYRKINSSNNDFEISSSPHDVLDTYGDDPKKLFPVVDTEIGSLAVYICYDGTFPEVARCLALNGAEVFCRPNNWAYGTVEATDLMRMHNIMRAFENTAYVVTCNWGKSPLAEYECSCGHAMVVDYNGRVLTEKQTAEESFVCDVIELKRLREHRRTTKFGNFLVQLRTECYASSYAQHSCWPQELYRETPLQDLPSKWDLYKDIAEELVKKGTYK